MSNTVDPFDDIVLDDYAFDADPPETTANDTHVEESTPIPEQPKKIEKIKLNESLLLETKGLPLLKNESRYIRFQGKGHEADDLKRLMTYYTVWANNLYPKLRFKDFARRVRKPASGNRIKEMLSVWQQEHTEKVQARREVLQELSGETVGDVDGENQREEEESSDDDNRPLFFPISSEAAEAMKKNKNPKKKIKSTKTSSKSNSKHRSKDTINSSDEGDSEDEPTTQPRTITFTDSEDEDDNPVRQKKPEPSPVNGRAHALAILAEKRRQKLQAQQGDTPQKEREIEEEKEEETRPRIKSSARIMESDSEEEDFDEELRKILDHKPLKYDTTVELAKSDDEIEQDIPQEKDTGFLDDVAMEDIEMEEI